MFFSDLWNSLILSKLGAGRLIIGGSSKGCVGRILELGFGREQRQEWMYGGREFKVWGKACVDKGMKAGDVLGKCTGLKSIAFRSDILASLGLCGLGLITLSLLNFRLLWIKGVFFPIIKYHKRAIINVSQWLSLLKGSVISWEGQGRKSSLWKGNLKLINLHLDSCSSVNITESWSWKGL